VGLRQRSTPRYQLDGAFWRQRDAGRTSRATYDGLEPASVYQRIQVQVLRPPRIAGRDVLELTRFATGTSTYSVRLERVLIYRLALGFTDIRTDMT